MDRLERRGPSTKLGVWLLVVLSSVALAALVVLILTVQPGEETTKINCTATQSLDTTEGLSTFAGPATTPSERASDWTHINCEVAEFKCNNSTKEDESARKQNRIQVEDSIKKIFVNNSNYNLLDVVMLAANGKWLWLTPEKFHSLCKKQGASGEDSQGISKAKEYFRNASGWPMLEGEATNITWTFEMIWQIEILFKTLFLEGRGLTKTSVGLGEKRGFVMKIEKPDSILPTDVNDLLDYWMYKKSVAKLFGAKEDVIEAEIRKVFKFEKTLDKLIQDRKYLNTTRITAFKDVKHITRLNYIPWNKLLSFFKKYDSEEVQYEIAEDYLFTLREVVERKNFSLKDVANFLFWRLAEQLAPYISKDFRTNIPFGERKNSSLDYCLETVSRHTVPIIFSEHISQDFKSKKEEVNKMTENIRQEIINYVNSKKVSPEKEKIIEKIKSITVHIGYPKDLDDSKKLIDYYNEFIKASHFLETTNFLDAHLKLSKWNSQEMIKKNRMYTEWMNFDDLLTPKASYNEGQKYIAVSIGLLERPYFDLSMLPSLKYGSLGYTIANLFIKALGDSVCKESPCSETVNVVFKALKSSELRVNTTTSNPKRMAIQLRTATSPSPQEPTTQFRTVVTSNAQVTTEFQENSTVPTAQVVTHEDLFMNAVAKAMCKTYKESKVNETMLNSIKLMELC